MPTFDLITAANEPVDFPLGGEPYPVRSLKLKEWAPLQAWLVNHFPGPVTQAAWALEQARGLGRPLTPETEELLLDHAHRDQRAWPPRVGSLAWRDALNADRDGAAQFLFVVLAASHPGFTRDRAEALNARVTSDELVDVYNWAVHGVRGPKEPAAGPPAGPGPGPGPPTPDAAADPSPTSGASSPST